MSSIPNSRLVITVDRCNNPSLLVDNDNAGDDDDRSTHPQPAATTCCPRTESIHLNLAPGVSATLSIRTKSCLTTSEMVVVQYLLDFRPFISLPSLTNMDKMSRFAPHRLSNSNSHAAQDTVRQKCLDRSLHVQLHGRGCSVLVATELGADIKKPRCVQWRIGWEEGRPSQIWKSQMTFLSARSRQLRVFRLINDFLFIRRTYL